MNTHLSSKTPFTGAERTLRVEKNQGRVPECGIWVGKESIPERIDYIYIYITLVFRAMQQHGRFLVVVT